MGKEEAGLRKILIVEDDKVLNKTLAYNLTADGYEVTAAYSFQDAVERLKKSEFDIALLDINLPDGNGLHLCDEIRGRGQHTYIMFITANDKEGDMLKGYEAGCTDYITKPFNPLELVARVKAQLRRYKKYNQTNDNVNVIDFKGLIIDNDSHSCTLYDKQLNLTPIEFSILWYLCKNRGRVVPSEELFEAVWKEKYFDSNNTVMVHIRRLREKMMEPPKNPRFIKTVWGVGYKIEE